MARDTLICRDDVRVVGLSDTDTAHRFGVLEFDGPFVLFRTEANEIITAPLTERICHGLQCMNSEMFRKELRLNEEKLDNLMKCEGRKIIFAEKALRLIKRLIL